MCGVMYGVANLHLKHADYLRMWTNELYVYWFAGVDNQHAFWISTPVNQYTYLPPYAIFWTIGS